MTDIEMTRLCAEAMGEIWAPASYPNCVSGVHFDPLYNDAQAMALVKKFRNDSTLWHVIDLWFNYYGIDDLNRAIVECVAKMQAEK